MNVKLRTATLNDAAVLADIYNCAVHAVDPRLYTEAEKAAWARDAGTSPFWKIRIPRTRPVLAERDGMAVGLLEYLPGGYLNCLYVHPHHQQQGIASVMLKHAATMALQEGCGKLYADVSKAALPFFQRHGFVNLRENHIARENEVLINYRMYLQL
ncbi:GNAT family N-acetyltransferase [Neisseria sp. S1]|uniref:GNAT family N-acetyltransferase n=1 Tax=Neisseria sp. S1 TaxID=3318354 RepID=UPI003A8BA5C4